VNRDDLRWDRPDLHCEPSKRGAFHAIFNWTRQARGFPVRVKAACSCEGCTRSCIVQAKVARCCPDLLDLRPSLLIYGGVSSRGASTPRDPPADDGFEVRYVPDDGAEHRVPLAQAWAVPLEQGIPVRQFTNLRGKFTTDTDGRFWFWKVKMDGVVGRLLKVQGRHPYRSAHVHALIFRAATRP
jgi:hypothetical protein